MGDIFIRQELPANNIAKKRSGHTLASMSIAAPIAPVPNRVALQVVMCKICDPLQGNAKMSASICRLCEANPTIKGSHVTPALVYRAIKKDSVTGFLRAAMSPNQRMQDGDKHPLLCVDCEQRFGERETKFNNHIFKAFHESDQDTFDYGDWLHYFLTSVAWRTLIMDLADPSTVARIPARVLPELEHAASTMQRYLLGENNLADLVRNHVILFAGAGDYSPQLAAAGPNFIIRRSVGGYTLWSQGGFSCVIHNLAGFFCATHIRGKPSDIWNNTKISPAGGRITQPQKVKSWIVQAFFEDIIEFSKNREMMSDKQLAIVKQAVPPNPTAPSLRFWESDRRLIHGEQFEPKS
jgi:hypothetical protein